ncbi:alkaline phosphatase D family protein [Devosia riboflavina]
MTASFTADFPNGVSAGDVTQHSALLWTRAADAGRLRLQVAIDPLFYKVIETQRVQVSDSAVPVKIEVDHLKAGTDYYYRFIDASGDVIGGSFRTAAATGTSDGFHFGVVSDMHGADFAPFGAIRNAPASDLDLLVKLGDQVFADQPPPGAATLAEFRAEHEAIYSEKFGFNFLADLQANTPILSMPDDAELVNNWAGGASPASDPRFSGQGGDFINETPLYGNAMRAFQNYNAIENRSYHHTGDDRFDGAPDLYRYQTYGSDAAVFMLDARSFRDAEVASPLNPLDPSEVAPFLANAFETGRTMLGEVQFERLKQNLLDARDQGVVWKFVMLPEPIQNYGPLVDAGDRYEGYAAERAALLAFIDDNHIENVVFVSGDTHWYSVNNLTYQAFAGGPQIASSAFEVVVPSVGGDLIGPLVAPTAAALGLITPAELAYYESLPNAPDADSVLNDKDDFNEFVLDTVLAGFGYDPLGLDNNLPAAAGKVNATLLQGAHFVSHYFGWSDFSIDGAASKLTVTTWGMPGYSPAELAADPAAILERSPTIVSQFEVTPQSNSILGTSRGDRIVGTSADDVILGAAGDDRLRGNDGADYLDGSVGNDNLEGGGGDDQIHGRAGNDRLYGNAGADTLSGGQGRDALYGGEGDDLFVFAPDFGRDTIYDFDANPAGGQDMIDISDLGITPEEFAARVKIYDIGAHVQIVIDADLDQSIQLFGVGNVQTVTQADFII